MAEAARQKRLRQLVFALGEARKRVARELHDQLGQQFSALRLGLSTLNGKATARGVQRYSPMRGANSA